MGRLALPGCPAYAPGGFARAGLVCWLGGVLAADARYLHLRLHLLRAAGLAGALLGVTVGPPRPGGADLLAQRLVTGARAQRAAQVVPGPAEQAAVELAVGGQPGAGAAAAKRLGDRGDHADLTAAVAVAVPAGGPPRGGRDEPPPRAPPPPPGEEVPRGGGPVPPAPPRSAHRPSVLGSPQ